MSDIFITYPNVDRIMTFVQRQLLGTNRNFVFCGPSSCGKSALIKRFAKHILSISDSFVFCWLKTFNRFSLLKMQDILKDLLEKQSQTKIIASF